MVVHRNTIDDSTVRGTRLRRSIERSIRGTTASTTATIPASTFSSKVFGSISFDEHLVFRAVTGSKVVSFEATVPADDLSGGRG
jgi:hypothetical protein